MSTDPIEPTGRVIAIDIALEPDAAMTRCAEAANETLRQNFPQGFALDDTHHAHIAVLQCFVRADALREVYAAVEGVLARHAYTGWRLTAFKYYYVPAGPIGLAGIVVKPTTQLAAGGGGGGGVLYRAHRNRGGILHNAGRAGYSSLGDPLCGRIRAGTDRAEL